MINTDNSLNIKELCSRKLWDLLIVDCPVQTNHTLKKHLAQELLSRRHYLVELEQLQQQLH